MTLTDRVAIVTGAGSERGIGKSIALTLARYGADIVVADLNLEGAEKVAEQIRQMGRRALAVKVNVVDKPEVDAMMEKAVAEFGKLDILINNAGITQPVSVPETSEEDWDRIINVNMKSTFLCSQAAIEYMKKNRYGRIVNMSSVSGKQGGGVFGGAHYSAAKAGILGFSKALAKEVVGDNITVNSVAPGAISTDIRKGISDEKEKFIWDSNPMKRAGKAEEVAFAVAFLAADEASYITGEDIDINGGSYID
jgi:NAD(P)-dependent dehydrogenase (short-subunit alcohol dehydrogenase family)